MNDVKKIINNISFYFDRYLLIFPITFILFLYLSKFLIVDNDLWLHLKIGESIFKNGIIYKDIFSYTAQNRFWIPSEWLFQLGIYLFSKFLGFSSLQLLIAIFSSLNVTFFYILIRKLLKSDFWIACFASFIYLCGAYGFFTLRPQVISSTLLLILLCVIFLYLFRNKNLLWISIPVTLIWSNIHPSFFLEIGLFLFYFLICIILFLKNREKIWLNKAKIFGIYSLVTGILTILPPIGIFKYESLYTHAINRSVLAQVIEEWRAMIYVPGDIRMDTFFIIYLVTLLIVLVLFIYSQYKNRDVKKLIIVLPFLLLPFFAFTALRNLYYGYLSLSILLAISISDLKILLKPRARELIIYSLLFILAIVNIYFLFNEFGIPDLYYPVNATKFIKDEQIKGNMFNELGYGGYLMYNLYPQKKVFIDGRAIQYLCCEIPDYIKILNNKYLPDKEYKKFLDNLWLKYNISFIILKPAKYYYTEKIIRIYSNESNWSLVFWDDRTAIIVKKDGKNTNLINKFEAKFATPYEITPFRKEDYKRAKNEYQRMIRVSDSAKSENALGLIANLENNPNSAEEYFFKAIKLNGRFESPYMNLGELLIIENKDYPQAISLYEKALKVNPFRPFIYLRLGQLYESTENKEKANEIWTKGLRMFPKGNAHEQFQKLLDSKN